MAAGGPSTPWDEALADEAGSVYTYWRLLYNLPPNDPRWLEITEIEVLADLRVRQLHNDAVRQATDPRGHDLDEFTADPARAEAHLERVRESTMSDRGVLAALQRLGIGGKGEGAPVTRRVNLTVGTSKPPGGVRP